MNSLKFIIKIVSVLLIALFGYYSYKEISIRLEVNQNIETLKNAYNLMNKEKDYSHLLNGIVKKGNSDKESIIFLFKTKTNCIRVFDEVKPLFIKIDDNIYDVKKMAKPKLLCHSNYEHEKLNSIEIFKN